MANNGFIDKARKTYLNKDIDGSVASNISRITVPKASTDDLASLERKQATIAYDTTTDALVVDSGAGFVAITPSINELLPDQASHAGEFLSTDGTNVSWQAAGGSGANQALSNLASVSINADLTMNTSDAHSIGGSGKPLSFASANAYYIRDNNITRGSILNIDQGAGLGGEYLTFYGQDPDGGITKPVALTTADGLYTSVPSANLLIATGAPGGGSTSGNINIITKDQLGAASAGSGNINITCSASDGVRGHITLAALYATLPTGTTNPTAPAGSVYYNTGTNKLRLYDGSTWVDLN